MPLGISSVLSSFPIKYKGYVTIIHRALPAVTYWHGVGRCYIAYRSFKKAVLLWVMPHEHVSQADCPSAPATTSCLFQQISR